MYKSIWHFVIYIGELFQPGAGSGCDQRVRPRDGSSIFPGSRRLAPSHTRDQTSMRRRSLIVPGKLNDIGRHVFSFS